jgi:hypothetical protein
MPITGSGAAIAAFAHKALGNNPSIDFALSIIHINPIIAFLTDGNSRAQSSSV